MWPTGFVTSFHVYLDLFFGSYHFPTNVCVYKENVECRLLTSRHSQVSSIQGGFICRFEICRNWKWQEISFNRRDGLPARGKEAKAVENGKKQKVPKWKQESAQLRAAMLAAQPKKMGQAAASFPGAVMEAEFDVCSQSQVNTKRINPWHVWLSCESSWNERWFTRDVLTESSYDWKIRSQRFEKSARPVSSLLSQRAWGMQCDR